MHFIARKAVGGCKAVIFFKMSEFVCYVELASIIELNTKLIKFHFEIIRVKT